jgi:hypothetical protein
MTTPSQTEETNRSKNSGSESHITYNGEVIEKDASSTLEQTANVTMPTAGVSYSIPPTTENNAIGNTAMGNQDDGIPSTTGKLIVSQSKMLFASCFLFFPFLRRSSFLYDLTSSLFMMNADRTLFL